MIGRWPSTCKKKNWNEEKTHYDSLFIIFYMGMDGVLKNIYIYILVRYLALFWLAKIESTLACL